MAVICEFYATWCQPCQALKSVYEKMTKAYAGKAHYLRVDVDQVNELTIEYDIEKLPTFIVMKGGKKVDRSEGPNKKALEALIKKHI